MKSKIGIIIITFCLIGFAAIGQSEEDETPKNPADAFNLISAGYAGAGAAPKVNLKTYKFTALVGKSELDFYLFNSVPTIVPKLRNDATNPVPTEESNPSKRYLANDILQNAGGLLNISLGKVGYFGYGKDPKLKYSRGIQMDLRLGGKLLEAPFETKSEFFPAVHSFFDLRYLIPLVDGKQMKKGLTKEQSMVGNLSFRAVLGLQKFFTNEQHNDTYSRFFTTFQNNGSTTLQILPKDMLITGNFEGFLYLSNKIYLSAGYYFSNDKLIDSYPYFSVSYGSK